MRVGGLQSAPGVPAAMAPEAAGTERTSRGGVSLAQLQANSEGSPPRGVPARSQPEEFRAAARGDAQGPNGRAPPGQERDRPGGLRRAEAQSPRGKRYPTRVARKTHLAARGSSKQPRERPARPVRRPGTGPDRRRAPGADGPSVVCVTLRCCSIFIHLLVSVGFILTRLRTVWHDY